MSALILAFCVHEDRQAVARAVLALDPSMLLWYDVAGIDIITPNRPLILLAFGAEGGAALARWVDAHGLDGVAGIGLVGVTAPWAERRASTVREFWRAPHETTTRLPLGPLESLRKVAERARVGEPCPCEHHPDPNRVCASCINRYTNSIRLVITCAPDDGVCEGCGGKAAHQYREGSPYNMLCAPCQGTGKALSSADVARELSGERCLYDGIDDFQATTGGLTVIHYWTHVVLAEHGLAAVLKAVGS